MYFQGLSQWKKRLYKGGKYKDLIVIVFIIFAFCNAFDTILLHLVVHYVNKYLPSAFIGIK